MKKPAKFSVKENKIITMLIKKFATIEGEDVIGLIMKNTTMSESEVLRLSKKLGE